MVSRLQTSIIINDRGEFISFCVTQANVDDREPLKKESFLNSIFDKLFGDKGYISEKLTQLFICGWNSINHQYPQQYEE